MDCNAQGKKRKKQNVYLYLLWRRTRALRNDWDDFHAGRVLGNQRLDLLYHPAPAELVGAGPPAYDRVDKGQHVLAERVELAKEPGKEELGLCKAEPAAVDDGEEAVVHEEPGEAVDEKEDERVPPEQRPRRPRRAEAEQDALLERF